MVSHIWEGAAKRQRRAKEFDACALKGLVRGRPAKKERFGHGKVSH